jgi:primosomal protein N' (replication factor Y)
MPSASPPRGITGSGKTLVYIELLREIVEVQGRSAIVLVPEIALTPQTVGRFREVFGDRVAVLHSALSTGERFDEWRALRAGDKRIAVGARSAIFAPLADVGAIIVDEEHEGSYKQGENPRYHAREVAIVRASHEGAVCVLGSATPSLESWHNATTGRFHLLELPSRATGQKLPEVRVVDLRIERKREREDSRRPAAGGRNDPIILTSELHAALADRLSRSEQSILLLNRRGYSNFVQCQDCGQVWDCPSCAVSLTYHRRRGRLTCHYCLYEEDAPDRCPRCLGSDVTFRGVGTEQVERAVGEAFPGARIARMDVDTTSAKWSHHRILDRFGNGEVDILMGTQMIAKGLDFHGVTLVGVINADVGINLPDFRATERTFQLLTQVAGRAGRGPKGGEVIIQTSLPNHYAIRAAVEHDFPGFAEQELHARQSPLYPPFCRLINVVMSARDQSAAQQAADRAAEWLRGLIASRGLEGCEVVGPAPCPIERIRDRWRWHFFLRAEDARLAGRIIRFFGERFRVSAGAHELRMVIDRDPVALL